MEIIFGPIKYISNAKMQNTTSLFSYTTLNSAELSVFSHFTGLLEECVKNTIS